LLLTMQTRNAAGIPLISRGCSQSLLTSRKEVSLRRNIKRIMMLHQPSLGQCVSGNSTPDHISYVRVTLEATDSNPLIVSIRSSTDGPPTYTRTTYPEACQPRRRRRICHNKRTGELALKSTSLSAIAPAL